MRIDPLERRVRLSVRELAGFRNAPPTDGQGGAPWRAAVGQEWHKALETRIAQTQPEARFETPVQAVWRHRDWTFEIQGRIDQVVPSDGGGQILREIKTVRHALPDADEALEARYPDYFAQAAVYLALARVLPGFEGVALAAELVFVDIDSGVLQTVPLGDRHAEAFTRQLDALHPFLDDRRAARVRLRDAEIRPAFQELRDGQAELFATLEQAALQARTVLLEAPTGFGKTGIVLEHALRRMRDGLYERCIYLTSKSTGQIQTIHQLRHMMGDRLRFLQMRNRKEHAIDSPAHRCTGDARCDDELGQRWREADLHPPELFQEGTFRLDRAKALGAATGVCPYALTKSCLPFAELWIGDLNYVFSPASRGVFAEPYGFDPAKTLLIVDEAHNLPDRAADALSVELDATDLLFALEELRAAGAPRRLLAIGGELGRCIESLDTGRPLPPNRNYEALDLCEDFARQLLDARFDYEAAAPFALDTIYRIPDLAKRLAEPPHEYLHWSPRPATLRATCLDASAWIAECLLPFGGSILMSATLAPYDAFRASCGLEGPAAPRPARATHAPKTPATSEGNAPAGSQRKGSAPGAVLAIGHAAWRDEAYQVAVDCRVDTRLKQRARHYETTARTVAALVDQSPGTPVAVFFASYQYAENIRSYLEAINPGFRVLLQPRGVDLAEQEEFIQEGLLLADALFLILGSSYAEGVDQLGGRVHTAMVVGPALPEVNCVQDAKMDAHPSLAREDNFRDVYIIPAMRRIHQALGRLVRAPGQRARILLHGKRFAEPAYASQLAPEYAQGRPLRSDTDLAEWLQATP